MKLCFSRSDRSTRRWASTLTLEVAVAVGDDGDGTYTARDKDHAHQLLGEGYQGNDVVDSAKALAGIEGLRMYDTKLYNTNQRIQSIHALLLSSGNRDMDYYPIEDYATTPGVHLLIRMIEESMDLDNPEKRASVMLFGESGISKSAFLKAIIGNMFGQGVIEVNGVEHIAKVVHAIKPNVPLLLEDFHWRITANGTAVVPISCVTGLLEQSNSNGTKEVMGRSGKNSYVPLKSIKMGSSNSLSFEDWYGAPIPEEHMRAIVKRCNLSSFTSFKFRAGQWWICVR